MLYGMQTIPPLVFPSAGKTYSGLILGLRPANERRRYFVTTSLIGWSQTKDQPCQLFIRKKEYKMNIIWVPIEKHYFQHTAKLDAF